MQNKVRINALLKDELDTHDNYVTLRDGMIIMVENYNIFLFMF
jgi:hypothetical protein